MAYTLPPLSLDEDIATTTNLLTGERSAQTLRATTEEVRERELVAWRRALEGIDFRLEHVEEPLTWFEQPPLPDEVERRRASLEAEREKCLWEIAAHEDFLESLTGEAQARIKAEAKRGPTKGRTR